MAIPHSETYPGIRGNGCVFIKSFVFNRTFRIKLASSASSVFPQYEGVPKVSILSATLFFLAIIDLIPVLPPGIRSSLYVDDFIIYTSDPSIPTLRQLTQSAIFLIYS